MFLVPRCLLHWNMTNASFTDRQMIWSTPWLLNSSKSSSYRGRWLDEQVGVKAPGSAKSTVFLPLKMSLLLSSCHRNGLSPGTLSSRTRVWNVTNGTWLLRGMIRMNAGLWLCWHCLFNHSFRPTDECFYLYGCFWWRACVELIGLPTEMDLKFRGSVLILAPEQWCFCCLLFSMVIVFASLRQITYW